MTPRSLTSPGSLPARVAADRVITRLREAERALQSAQTIHQAKIIADLAAAQELFAHRQRLGEAITGYAHEIKIHALAKLGGLLKVTPKATGAMGIGTSAVPKGNHTQPATYHDLGLSKKTAALAQRLAALSAPTRDAVATRTLTLAQALRAVRQTAMQTAPLPPGKFRVLYADPPWHYGNRGVITASDGYGRAARHYPSMTIPELCALEVAAHVHDHAVLFLWVTSPLLAECWPVIRAWGFTYKTSIVWDKVDHNYGSYVSVRHELLLICTRGSCLPDHPTPMPDSVMTIARSKVHSEKPPAFRALIDRLYDGDAHHKLELFARASVPGWTPYGNEVLGAIPITA